MTFFKMKLELEPETTGQWHFEYIHKYSSYI